MCLLNRVPNGQQEDLVRISELEAECGEWALKVKKVEDEMKFYKLELVNREENFTQKFAGGHVSFPPCYHLGILQQANLAPSIIRAGKGQSSRMRVENKSPVSLNCWRISECRRSLDSPPPSRQTTL